MSKPKRLTPLRAFELLRRLTHSVERLPQYMLDEVREALANHVRAGLRRPKRRGRVRE